MIIKMASKNILRNRRRTLLTSVAMILGIAGLLVFRGFIKEQMLGFRDGVIRSGIGHIQIATDDKFYSQGKYDPENFQIQDHQKIINEVSKINGVASVIPSSGFTALAAHDGKTVTLLFKAYQSDKIFFPKNNESVPANSISPASLSDGENFGSDANSIIIGKSAAEILNVKTGGVVTLMAILPGGGFNGYDYTVKGIYNGSDSSKIYAYIPLEGIAPLIGDVKPSSLTVFIKKIQSTDATAAAIKKLFPSHQIKTWPVLAEFYSQVNSMYDSFLFIIGLIIMLVTVFVIMNTMTMSVFERMREIGTLRAFGMIKSRIFFLLVVEGGTIGIFGSIIGIAAGMLISTVINIAGGIPFSYDGESFHIMVHPRLYDIFSAVIPVIIVSLIGSIPPAIRGAKLSIADTLRY